MRLISKTSSVIPIFFAFLAKVDLYLTLWQVWKKSVCGNILGVNVLNQTVNIKISFQPQHEELVYGKQ